MVLARQDKELTREPIEDGHNISPLFFRIFTFLGPIARDGLIGIPPHGCYDSAAAQITDEIMTNRHRQTHETYISSDSQNVIVTNFIFKNEL